MDVCLDAGNRIEAAKYVSRLVRPEEKVDYLIKLGYAADEVFLRVCMVLRDYRA